MANIKLLLNDVQYIYSESLKNHLKLLGTKCVPYIDTLLVGLVDYDTGVIQGDLVISPKPRISK